MAQIPQLPTIAKGLDVDWIHGSKWAVIGNLLRPARKTGMVRAGAVDFLEIGDGKLPTEKRFQVLLNV